MIDDSVIHSTISDCGYDALGLFIFLYSHKIEQMRIEGDYYNNEIIIEDILNLCDFRHLIMVEDNYFFPILEDNTYKKYGLSEALEGIKSIMKMYLDSHPILGEYG